MSGEIQCWLKGLVNTEAAKRWFLFAFITVACFPCLSCVSSQQEQSIPHDAYIWQRRWTNSLSAAAQDSDVFIQRWRVLAGEVNGSPEVKRIVLDRDTLSRLRKPIIAVIRIESRAAPPLNVDLAEQIASLVADWNRGGRELNGVEVDYDCPASRLHIYRGFLHLLRDRLGRDTHLSMTALPSWMGSSDLSALLAEADENVLQVHSVDNKKTRLFDGPQATKWAREWSKITPTPFRLALPTYWSRVSWNEAGAVEAIESERSRYDNSSGGRELITDPREVSAVVGDLAHSPPDRFAGFVWFRLPTAEDTRAWTLETWHAVMLGQPLRPVTSEVRFTSNTAGLEDIYLVNNGSVDSKLPREIAVSGEGCEFADALPPYTLEQNGRVLRFVLSNDDLIHPGRPRLIGWARCLSRTPDAHVSF